MSSKNRKQSGFSLVELVAVVGVILVVAAFAAPTVTRALRTYRVGSAARDVSNIVQRTRYEAIRRNIATACRGQVVNGQWQIWVDLNANQRLENNEPFILLPPDITFLDANQVPSAASMGYNQTRQIQGVIVFDPRGTLDFGGQPPAVLLAFLGMPSDAGSGYRALAVAPNGKSRLWQATGGGAQGGGYWK